MDFLKSVKCKISEWYLNSFITYGWIIIVSNSVNNLSNWLLETPTMPSGNIFILSLLYKLSFVLRSIYDENRCDAFKRSLNLFSKNHTILLHWYQHLFDLPNVLKWQLGPSTRNTSVYALCDPHYRPSPNTLNYRILLCCSTQLSTSTLKKHSHLHYCYCQCIVLLFVFLVCPNWNIL